MPHMMPEAEGDPLSWNVVRQDRSISLHPTRPNCVEAMCTIQQQLLQLLLQQMLPLCQLADGLPVLPSDIGYRKYAYRKLRGRQRHLQQQLHGQAPHVGLSVSQLADLLTAMASRPPAELSCTPVLPGERLLRHHVLSALLLYDKCIPLCSALQLLYAMPGLASASAQRQALLDCCLSIVRDCLPQLTTQQLRWLLQSCVLLHATRPSFLEALDGQLALRLREGRLQGEDVPLAAAALHALGCPSGRMKAACKDVVTACLHSQGTAGDLRWVLVVDAAKGGVGPQAV